MDPRFDAAMGNGWSLILKTDDGQEIRVAQITPRSWLLDPSGLPQPLSAAADQILRNARAALLSDHLDLSPTTIPDVCPDVGM